MSQSEIRWEVDNVLLTAEPREWGDFWGKTMLSRFFFSVAGLALLASAQNAQATIVTNVILGTFDNDEYADDASLWGLTGTLNGQAFKLSYTYDSVLAKSQQTSDGMPYSVIDAYTASTSVAVTVNGQTKLLAGPASVFARLSSGPIQTDNRIFYNAQYLSEEDTSIYPSDPDFTGHFTYSANVTSGALRFYGGDVPPDANFDTPLDLRFPSGWPYGSIFFYNYQTGGGEPDKPISVGGGNFHIDRIYTLPSASSVPEPTTWTTMIFGLAMIGGAARRRRSFLGRLA